MIYSTEIENMCPVRKGANHGPAPIRRSLGKGKGNIRHFRFYSWNRLVCTTAGMLQVNIECERWYY